MGNKNSGNKPKEKLITSQDENSVNENSGNDLFEQNILNSVPINPINEKFLENLIIIM